MSSDRIHPSAEDPNVERQIKLINTSLAQTSLKDKIPSPEPYKSCILNHDDPKATEFPQFPDLPMELRLKIWKSAVFPRMVFLNGKKGSLESQFKLWTYLIKQPGYGELLRPGENEKFPVLLGACQESRMELGKLYRHRFCWFHDCRDYSTIQTDGFLLDFKISSDLSNMKAIDYTGSLFNPNVDVLILWMPLGPIGQYIYLINPADLAALRHIVIYDDDENDDHSFSDIWRASHNLFESCPNLERLHLYLRNPNDVQIANRSFDRITWQWAGSDAKPSDYLTRWLRQYIKYIVNEGDDSDFPLDGDEEDEEDEEGSNRVIKLDSEKEEIFKRWNQIIHVDFFDEDCND